MAEPLSERLRIAVASDAAGALHRQALAADLAGHPLVECVVDLTPGNPPPYPEAALAAGRLIADGGADRALLVCHTGLGVAVAANKVPGIRAVTAHDPYSVEHAVRYTNAQVLCLGQAIVPLQRARELLAAWLVHRFDPATSAAAKVAAITAYERTRDHHPA
ncbi:RpiB/LacA/LacB family sugar-phosphate isomerase [Streptomyces sp. LaPpAH-108]|uniref:RpiB/LacA/LacB family sugar-phosphate isomerase n=1 Tax=Streptomyces sp. LaPpAH-108 TaxID=1155714 RepID=UPI00036A94D0|nr:RpiB/LacA/LacB family sugar-phosphate isomerase [Streptomyces sp. LaPpAH-108]